MQESVYSEILDGDVLTRLSGQMLHARMPMVGNIVGQHKSPYRGSSVEFAEYRKYVPGDDPKLLDWRVLARTDRYYIREFEADTNLRCYVVIDCSKSMAFGERGTRKFDYARKIAATLSYMLVSQGDAVGLQLFDDGVLQDIPPRRNPLHLRYIFDTIAAAEPKGETGLVKELHMLAERIRQRAMVIIISDCFCDVDELLNCFEHLHFQKHDFALFHLLDPLELDLDLDRPVRFLDMESDDVLLAEPEVIREPYIEAVNEYLELVHQGCNKHNADYRRVLTDQPYDTVIADFLVDREQLAKARG